MSDKNKHSFPVGSHLTYIIVVGLVFAALSIVFICFPRSVYSELENRDLAEFPDISKFKDDPAGYTAAVSQWFSDSEPYRDKFMTMSMNLRDMLKVRFGSPENSVSVQKLAENVDMNVGVDDLGDLVDNSGNPLADANAKMAASGIIIAGAGDNIRGLMAFGGSEKAGEKMAETANLYGEAFPNQNVYVLVAPLATEFYLPEKASSSSRPQLPPLEHMRNLLKNGVKYVDAYSYIKAHTMEDVYLRTDHHWAPLGAYYAAQAFAKTAGVPFPGLDKYDKHVIRNFVGTVYNYSKDIEIKKHPEDFVYYTPKGLNPTTTFVTYKVNKNYQVVSESAPYTGEFFHKFNDGSSSAYLTFMGGDQHLVKVQTGAPGNRKLLIIKDSYGNALPGYMFFSFNEIHVVDFRYFTKNLKKYVADNGITDILIAFNIFNACNSASLAKIRKFIDQPSGISAQPDAVTSAKEKPGQKKAPEKVEDKNKVEKQNKEEIKTEVSPESTSSAPESPQASEAD